MPRIHPGIPLTDEQTTALRKIATTRSVPQHWAAKANTILRLAADEEITIVAKDLGVSRTSVTNWRDAFVENGVDTLTSIRPGRGRKATISSEVVERIVNMTLQTCPVNATH
jgi:transposase